MGNIAIQFENISKQYRLGLVSTKTLSHDLNRWWQTAILKREDPYLKIGETNDRSVAGSSEYVWALRDINFKVEQGDVLGIIGKNGAGKSTLLKILSRVTTPTTGTIKARGKIASLLEVGTGFHPELTGRENIYMNGAIMGMTKSEISRKLDEIVEFAGVARYIDTPTKRYSSGMTVRLGFAIAAHLDPEILVVDEVLAVGDAEFQKKAVGKMQEVSRGEGRTVLFVSHNMASVRTLCNKGVLLQDGCMSFTGNIEETIDLYVKTDEIDETELIINKIKPISKEIQITNVLVNNSATSILTLSHPNNTITIQVQGKCLNDVRGAIEVLIFDTHNVLLAKYAPALKSGIASKIKAGNFSMKETVSLPDQMTNGVYYLQINITNPNIEFLAKIPKAVKVISNNFTGKTGISIDYKHSGFLSLS